MLLLIYGTRPEYIKLFPLIKKFKEKKFPFKLLFTGQQEDIGEFDYDYKMSIKKGVNRLDSIIESSMNFLPTIDENITHILVQGDTTSALALALSAFNNGYKVIHLEAGLRTYDNQNPYPEEINRRIISQVTDIHLCPTELSKQNLISERILGDKYIIGNTVLDNLLPYKDRCEYTNKVLVTMHRRENHHIMDKWFIIINELAKKCPDIEFILPLHPNPNVQKRKHLLNNVKVVDPLSHEDLLNILVKTKLVITDSGGLVEESDFLGKKVLTCRSKTERTESLGKSNFLVKSPEELLNMFSKHINDYKVNFGFNYGDGSTSKKIYNILNNYIL